jgi:arylformamidase
LSDLIDISPPISDAIAVWPGDVTYQREVAYDMAEGAHMTLSAIRTTLHVGAHADAPNHYAADGAGIGAQDLTPYYGPCQVIRVDVALGDRIRPTDLGVSITQPRVLFYTGSFPEPDTFNEDFVSLSPELIHWLDDQGVVLVGIDTPSVDPFLSKALESHNALARTGMANLEGVVLSHVTPGDYTLIALPLPLTDADASPVRAALAPLDAR